MNINKLVSLRSLLTSESVQELLMERCKSAALATGLSLLEEEVFGLCGKPHSRKTASQYHRGGSERSSIVVGGAKASITRPRVRGPEGEVELEILKKLRDQDLLDNRLRDKMLLGVSTRNYGEVIDEISDKIGVSKSSVSRAFIRSSLKDLEKINTEDLAQYSFVGMMIDGVEIEKSSVIVAMGITADLSKIPLGIREGTTENSELVKDLLTVIRDRNFKFHCERLLVVVDGSTAIKKGLREVFGERVFIQRCWLHKLRNLKAYVPEGQHGQLLWRMKKLMGMSQYADAKRELESMIQWLSTISHEAENSLLECGEDLITVHALGLPKLLKSSLSTTNAIESLLSVVRTKSSGVKNWKSKKTKQISRWVASAITSHRKKMRRLRGWKDAQVLADSLNGVERKLLSA